MKLSDLELRKLKTEDKPYRVHDGRGLFIEVTPTGGKLWRWAYRFQGKQKKMGLGQYPEVSLKLARERHIDGRRILAMGIDPMTQRKETRRQKAIETAECNIQKTTATWNTATDPKEMVKQALKLKITPNSPFGVLAFHWWDHWKVDKDRDNADAILSRLVLNLFPALRSMPISVITSQHIIQMVQSITERGAAEMAKRCLGLSKQVFEYATTQGYATSNPAAGIKPSLVIKAPSVVNRARVNAADLPALLKAVDVYKGRKIVQLMIQMMFLSFTRTGELLGAVWTEFDFEAMLWRIPQERMKMKSPHIVPLSNQMLAVLRELRELSGESVYLFPSEFKSAKTLNENTILNALAEMGYKGVQTGHGFRGLASTILHERGFDPEHIELQLAHARRNKVSAAYNHALYLEPRVQMMQDWADYLDRLRRS
jgi:integrase